MATVARTRSRWPVHRVPRAGRTPGHAPWTLWTWGDLCGTCTGTRLVWCPDCGGFAGCGTCRRTFEVPCPECAGSDHEPWNPSRGSLDASPASDTRDALDARHGP